MPSRLLAAVPNGLSLLRVGLALGFPFVPDWSRPWIIAAAAATDFLDGFSARRLNVDSETGRLLDPIADKLFVLILAVTLVAEGSLDLFWAAGIAVRDFVVTLAAVVLVFRRFASVRPLRPSWLGKATTAGQFAVLLAAVVWNHAPVGLLAATTALSVAAAVDYARRLRTTVG